MLMLSVAGNFVDRIFRPQAIPSTRAAGKHRKQPAVGVISLAKALRGYRTRAREMIHEFLLSSFPLPRRVYRRIYRRIYRHGRDRQFALS
jgi:hypothetical protein